MIIHLGSRLPDDQNDIRFFRKLIDPMSGYLFDQPFNPISDNRISHFPADGDPDSSRSLFSSDTLIDYKLTVGRGGSDPENATKVIAPL